MSARPTSSRVCCVALALAALVAALRSADAQQCGPEAVTQFGRWFSPAITISASQRTLEFDHGFDGYAAVSTRLLVGITAGTSLDWNFVVRDRSYRVLANLGPEDFRDDTGGLSRRRWTGRLPAVRMIADLVAAADSDIQLEILSGIAYPNETVDTKLFSIVQKNKEPWQELYEQNDNELAKRAGDSVGMLLAAAVHPTTLEKRSWCCSGVMLSHDVMLTNWHCGGSRDIGMADARYWNNSVCENTIVDLGWAKGALNRQYSCVNVLAKDRALDFALIRIRPVIGPGGLSGAAVRARLSRNTLADGQNLFVVHHTKCGEKLVSSGCQVQSASYPGWKDDENDAGGSTKRSDFSHDCNTEQGASGAPVFDIEGRLVGLHHVGVKRGPPPQCEELDAENKAVNIREIFDFLRREKPDVAAELRLD